MDLGIRGRTALVLGAGGGLGRAIARALSAEGVRVALGDIDSAAVEETARVLRQEGGKALPLTWDLGDLAQIGPNVERIEAELGPIDILVNNTGGPKPSTVSGQDAALWQQSFQTMVLSVIALTDSVLPGMRERKWGRIVNIGSINGQAGQYGQVNYAAAKSGIHGFTKALAQEGARVGVTVNAIAPGYIATNNTAALQADETRNRQIQERIPAGRWGAPSDIGGAAVFLSSPAANYIHGHVLAVDGGWLAR